MMRLACLIGTPLKADEATMRRSRVGYARVFVEIAAGRELPTTLEYEVPSGDIYTQRVEYEWIPPLCHQCQSFGHPPKDCAAKVENASVADKGGSDAGISNVAH